MAHTIEDLYAEIDRQDRQSFGNGALLFQSWRALDQRGIHSRYGSFRVTKREHLKGRAFLIRDCNGKPGIDWLDEAQPLAGRGFKKIRFTPSPLTVC